MQIIRTIRAMQALAWEWDRAQRPNALVPTMGALHEGHLSLIRGAREWVGEKGAVVVSIYVNPTQFGPKEDLAKYPRPFARDCKLCLGESADVVFAPSDKEMYPAGFSTWIEESRLTQPLEGAKRPTHFRGVCTVVSKLFQITQPEVALFGQKDLQQVLVIEKMVADLNFPIKVVVCPTVREADGLAMSSRNMYLSADERRQAVVLKQALDLAQSLVKHGERSVEKIRQAMQRVIETAPLARLDYVELVELPTLQPLRTVKIGKTAAVLAVYVGKTRLIDNAILR